jgi:hypothetical protein
MYVENMCAWNVQYMYVIPVTRICNHQVDRGLKLNGIQTGNALEVRELRTYNFAKLIQIFTQFSFYCLMDLS